MSGWEFSAGRLEERFWGKILTDFLLAEINYLILGLT